MSQLLSVVIPTYNRDKYIYEAVNSVLKQKLPSGFDIEVIVVDDGSTDNTREVLNPIMDKIKYEKIQNSGRPAIPRNVGINMAKGSFIAFQDSDDIWTTGKLLAQLSVFKDPSVVLSFGNAEFMTADGYKSGKTILTRQPPEDDVFSNLLKENFISTLTVICRTSFIKKAGLFNESKGLRGVEDYELWLRLSVLGKFSYVDRVQALYRQHDENISPKNELQSYRNIKLAYKACIKNDTFSMSQRRQLFNALISIQAAIKNVSPSPWLSNLLINYYRLRRKLL